MLAILHNGTVDYVPTAEDQLTESIILSLGCDSRYEDPQDPWISRGWWGDRFSPENPIGSGLWALSWLRGEAVETIAKKEIEKSLAWLKPDRVLVTTDASTDLLKVVVEKSGKEFMWQTSF